MVEPRVRERRTDDNQLRPRDSHFHEQFGETYIVANRETDPPERRIGDGDFVARLDVRALVEERKGGFCRSARALRPSRKTKAACSTASAPRVPSAGTTPPARFCSRGRFLRIPLRANSRIALKIQDFCGS